jgi:DNA-binding SARP family transcriptional activator
MEFRVLGPVQVWSEGVELAVSGRQRELLALLLIGRERVVSADRLVDELWGERPPRSADNMLHSAASRLRKALGPGGGELVVSQAPGYALHVLPEQVDAARFELLQREGERLLQAGDLGAAAARFRDGLALWRGPAFADAPATPTISNEAARLEELRLLATELRIEAELGLGRDGSVIAELEALVAEHPHRERLRGELMLALYRSGRQPEALDVYRDARRRLVDELGIEPSPRLRELEHAILAQDPALDAPGDAPPLPRPPRRRRRAWLVATVVALGAAASVAGIALVRDGEPHAHAAVPVKAHSLAVVDPASNAVVADLVIGGWPRGLATGGGFVWAARTGADTVLRVDPAKRAVVGRFAATTPLDLAWLDGVLWIANGNSFDGPNPPGGGTVERFNVATRERRPISVGPATPGNAEQTVVATGPEGVWVGNVDAARVVRLDQHSGLVAATVPTTLQVVGIALGAGSVWAADAVNEVVYRIDPRTAGVVARIPVRDGPRHIAVGEGAAWVLTEFPQSVISRIDLATNRVVAHVEVPRTANWLTVGGGSVWVTSNNPGHAGPGSLSRIDPATNRVVATIDLGFSPEDVVVANGLVWVLVGPS